MMKSKQNLGHRRGQRGFTLVVIFLLLALMAASATAVLLASRTDMRISGRHRETSLAFFSAEAGVAYGKAYLAAAWNAATFWTGVLSDPATVAAYNVGGITVGTEVLPTLNARYTYSFKNNTADPSGDPMIDQDGRVIITSVGEALDAAGTKVLARVTLQVEVVWQSLGAQKGDYQAQANQSASGTAASPDNAGVSLSAKRTF